MVRKGVIDLVEIPDPYGSWESNSLLDMQPDGTATFAMSASMIGVVGETTEHAMIRVRDGKSHSIEQEHL